MSHKTKNPLGETKGSKKILSDSYIRVLNERNDYKLSEENYFSKSNLLSKDSVDTVKSINGKTSAETEVLLKLREGDPELTIDNHSHIVAHDSFSRQQENVMSEKIEINFSKRPDLLKNNTAFKSARLKHKFFYLELLSKITFKEIKYDINGQTIILKKFQYCASYTQLAEEMTYGSRRKEDKFSINDIRGCIEYFCRVGLLTQDLTHGRSVLTIPYLDICEMKSKDANTGSNNEVTQRSHIKENEIDEKERKIAIRDDNDTGVIGGIVAAESPFANLKKKRKVTEEEFLELKEMCSDFSEISERTMKIWLSKYSAIYIAMQLDVLAKTKKVENQEKWMEKALVKNYAKDKKNMENNKKFMEDFKEKNQWCKIEILKQYCNVYMPGGSVQDYSFSLDPEIFKMMIQLKFEMIRGIQ